MARLPKLTRAERARLKANDQFHHDAVQEVLDAVDRAGSVMVDLRLRGLTEAVTDEEPVALLLATRALVGAALGAEPFLCGCCDRPFTEDADLRVATWFTICFSNSAPVAGLICSACAERPDIHIAVAEALLGPCEVADRRSLTGLEPRGNA